MKATGISIYRATLPVIVACGAVRHRALYLRPGVHPSHQQTAGDSSQPDQGQAAANLPASRSQMDFRREQPDLLLPGLRSRHRSLRRNLRLRIRPSHFPDDPPHLTPRAHWEPSSTKWVFEDGWARTFHGASIHELPHLRRRHLPRPRRRAQLLQERGSPVLRDGLRNLRNYIHDLQQSGFDTVRLRVQLQKKLAYPLITLVMAILAIPFSARRTPRRRPRRSRHRHSASPSSTGSRPASLRPWATPTSYPRSSPPGPRLHLRPRGRVHAPPRANLVLRERAQALVCRFG